jgi:L-lactate dehydrogenase (cytochrome)
MFQFYFHKDRALNAAMLDMAKEAQFDILTLTVDTITGGNRERDLQTGFTTPPRLTPKSLFEFAAKPAWALNYLLREKFELSQLKSHVGEGSNIAISVGDYFSTMLDQNMNWDDAGALRAAWGGTFCLKGIMSAADARRAVDMGADAIMISNHGGRQLDGSRAPFDQLEEILAAVGGEIDVICDGGIRRGTHVLKAMALGATACSGGRLYLYALAAAGQAGVEKALANLQSEIERGMKLMGVSALDQLTPDMIRRRQV